MSLNWDCTVCTYAKCNFKPQISSIFHFDRVSDGWMAHLLGVKDYRFNLIQFSILNCKQLNKTKMQSHCQHNLYICHCSPSSQDPSPIHPLTTTHQTTTLHRFPAKSRQNGTGNASVNTLSRSSQQQHRFGFCVPKFFSQSSQIFSHEKKLTQK